MTETSYNLLVLAFPVLVPLTLAAITAILWRNIQAQRVVAIARPWRDRGLLGPAHDGRAPLRHPCR
jgi:hypothetical protein